VHLTPTDGDLVVRLLVAFGLSYVLGFERQLRGSPAGDRTFSLIGIGTALVGVLSESYAPNALAGAVTGVGFIGGGLVFRQDSAQGAVVRGITSAAAIFAVAAIGAAAGEGRLALATVGATLVLLCLEVQHIPGLRLLDARQWEHHFRPDIPTDPEPPTPPDTEQ
jgi:putative Mg2+ transporter-C (MgtC) family protein